MLSAVGFIAVLGVVVVLLSFHFGKMLSNELVLSTIMLAQLYLLSEMLKQANLAKLTTWALSGRMTRASEKLSFIRTRIQLLAPTPCEVVELLVADLIRFDLSLADNGTQTLRRWLSVTAEHVNAEVLQASAWIAQLILLRKIMEADALADVAQRERLSMNYILVKGIQGWRPQPPREHQIVLKELSYAEKQKIDLMVEAQSAQPFVIAQVKHDLSEMGF
jgi:hypothetical protein